MRKEISEPDNELGMHAPRGSGALKEGFAEVQAASLKLSTSTFPPPAVVILKNPCAGFKGLGIQAPEAAVIWTMGDDVQIAESA
jgi:hypothetical protein